MTDEERKQLKQRLIELRFWRVDEPGDPTTDVECANRVRRRIHEKINGLLATHGGVNGGASYDTHRKVLVIGNNIEGDNVYEIASGDTYAEAICLAAAALPEFLKQHPEYSGQPEFAGQIVVAWFESVINPMLNGLSLEKERLSKKSWTWQYIPGRLESIRYVGEMIPFGYEPNLEQFKKYYPVISENITFHDGQVAQLTVTCKSLQRAIVESGPLQEIFNSVTTAEALAEIGNSLDDLFFGGDAAEGLGWIAQEIINGSGKIPSYIGHSPLWNEHRDKFMQVLNHPQVSEAKALTDRAGEQLLQTVNRLIELLAETRDRLSLDYGVPLVPTPSVLIP